MARNQNQFVVPQFIEVESKIIGPISGRQFVILLVAGAISYVIFTLFTSPWIFLPGVLFTMGTGAVLAFAKVNGQSMHYFLLNMIQTLKRPGLKIWKREYLQRKKKKEDTIEQVRVVPKTSVNRSRLAEISLQVDTGGIYQTDQEGYK